jgi:hypothetical protein
VNDQQIYAVMAKTQDIRAAQIAEMLGRPLPAVSESLRSLVDIGDVVKTKGTDPQGAQAMIYNLSDEFKKSKAYESVAAIDAPKPAVVAPAAPAPVAVPTFVPAGQPTRSRAELGTAYVAEHGSVTQEALRTAMGLKRGEYPASYLTAAVRDGKLHKDGDKWKAGWAPSADGQHSTRSVKADGAVTVPAPVPAAPRAVASVFRCGLWSDGVLELERDGSTVAVLKQAEGEHLISFINRMLIDPMGVKDRP